MTGTEPVSPSAGHTSESGNDTEVRWLRLAQTVLTVVVVIASAIVTAYQSWRMRDLFADSTYVAVLFTILFVLVPPLFAYRAAHSPKGSTRTVLVLFLLGFALVYASLVAQYLTEHAGPHPWVVAAMLTYASAGGATLLYMRARP
jgi:RsiW-degrading membrane proteinase PrsW (M82 family)